MEFTSQIGQDRWVCEKFKYKRNGYFLDLGAFDGIFFNNTYYLEKVLGWNGICVEPDKDAFKQLVKNRNCLCIEKAISNVNAMVEFTKPGMHGYIKKGGELLVEAIMIEKLMADNNVPSLIDYISMDIEWQEIHVLPTFPFNKYEVILWTIEHNLYSEGPEVKQAIKEIMISNGYVIDRENVGIGRTISKSERIWWNKPGEGSLRLRIDGKKRMIKPNEKFRATEEEVPQSFQNQDDGNAIEDWWINKKYVDGLVARR